MNILANFFHKQSNNCTFNSQFPNYLKNTEAMPIFQRKIYRPKE